jgi:hypothetical protein
MGKFTASIEELFSAESEALTSNSANYIINQFQTNEQKETEYPTANIGRNQESGTGSATAFDPAISGVPEEHSTGSENDTASIGNCPCQKT